MEQMSEKERLLWAQLAEIAKNEPKRIEDPDGRAPIAVIPDDVWAVLQLYVPSRTGVITTQSVYDVLEAPLQEQINTGFCPEGFYSDDPDVALELATSPDHYVFASMREDLE